MPSSPSSPQATPTEPPQRRELLLLAAILLVSAALRLVLALLNDAANDNHLQVVQLLLEGRRDLTMQDCLVCFHPKLYHATLALLARILGLTTVFGQRCLGQLSSAVAGIATLFLLHRFLGRLRLAPSVRLLVLALAALNPAFLAINVQLTNDSLAILLAVAGIFWMAKFAEERKLRHFGLAAVCLTLGFASKATVWVAGIAAFLSLLAGALARHPVRPPRPGWNYLLAGILAVMLGSAIATAGYDFKSYRRYAGFGRDRELPFFRQMPVARPGVMSIYDGYLTFKFVELLRRPYTGNGNIVEPPHRTSVFSQLYGRLHFLHLDSWPEPWRLRDRSYLNVGRGNLVLGLLPTGLFLLGLGHAVHRQGKALRRDGPLGWLRTQPEPDLLCLLLCLGYLAFIVKFTADFRDYSAMKPIYVFPGMLGFVKLLADGYQLAHDRLAGARRLRLGLWGLSCLLLAGYVADVLVLAGQLIVRNGAALAPPLG
jgi:hypothetical protein